MENRTEPYSKIQSINSVEYKITENNSLLEMEIILSQTHGRNAIIMCENDKVFNTVIKLIDDERNMIVSKLRVE